MDRRNPLETILEVPGIMAVQVGCPHIVLFFLAGQLVVAPEAALAVGIDDIVVAGLGDRRPGRAL